MRPLLSIGFLALLLIPHSTSAVASTEWSFIGGAFDKGWEAGGNPAFTAKPGGLLITTTEKTLFGRSIRLTHPIEVVTIHYSSDKRIEGWIYWHKPGDPAEDLLRAPLLFSPTTGVGTVSADMTKYREWKRSADFVGVGLPKDSRLLIQSIELTSWSPAEKLAEAVKSFWTFDVRRPSSVNFLWGPHVAFNPLTRELMFRVTPPPAPSANRYFYFVMAAVAAWAYIMYMRKHPHPKRRALTLLMVSMAALWMLYDLRMGAEFFGYLQRDYNTYWSKPVGQRTFRERSYFNDFAAAITPLVQDREKYIFISTHRWPFLGLVRYYTYPSIPTHPFQEEKQVDTWVVYRRPDFVVNDHGELENEGIRVSAPGRVLHEFEEGTFVFREGPL